MPQRSQFGSVMHEDRASMSLTDPQKRSAPDAPRTPGSEVPAVPPPPWLAAVIGRRPKRTLVRIVVVVIGSFVLFGFALIPFRITGSSMEPAYRDGGVNFANRLVYLLRQPRRGDVVAIRMVAGRHVMLLKRIVGLPGERIAIKDGVVTVNGADLDEPYLVKPWRWHREELLLGPDEYYVIGDNRRMPQSAHDFGKFKAELIVGKVLF